MSDNKFEYYEYLLDDTWHECDEEWINEQEFKPNFNKFVYRETREYDDCKMQYWYMGNHWHRLDGPAIIEWDKKGNIIDEIWSVEDRQLPDLKKENLFEYIKKQPECLKDIELLASHNNWLSEKELLLLKTVALFT